jgi:hypothetical protein
VVSPRDEALAVEERRIHRLVSRETSRRGASHATPIASQWPLPNDAVIVATGLIAPSNKLSCVDADNYLVSEVARAVAEGNEHGSDTRSFQLEGTRSAPRVECQLGRLASRSRLKPGDSRQVVAPRATVRDSLH